MCGILKLSGALPRCLSLLRGLTVKEWQKKALQKALELLCNAVIQILVGVLLIVISRYI